MIAVEMRNADQLNFLKWDLVLPEVGLKAFTAVQQNPLPLPIDGLRCRCVLKRRRGCPTTKDGDLELHESTRCQKMDSVLNDHAPCTGTSSVVVHNEVQSVGPRCCF